MKKKKVRSLISILLTLAVALYPFAWSGAAMAAPEAKDVLVLKAGSVKGTIVDTTGRGVAKLPMKLLDNDGAIVTKTVTDESGVFTMKDLDAGRYTLGVGKDYNLKLALKKKGETSDMKVVVPVEGSVAPAAGFTMTHLLVGGIGVVIIGGVAVAASGGGGGGGRVSP